MDLEKLQNLHRKFREQIKSKNIKMTKLTDRYMPKIGGIGSRKSSSVPRARQKSRKGRNQDSMNSINDITKQNNFNEILNNHDEKTIEKLQAEIEKIHSKLRMSEDLER